MIAVNEYIIQEYLKYRKTDKDFDKNILQMFFQYYKPFVVSVKQLINIGYEKKTALLLYTNSEVFNKLSIRTSNIQNDTELIQDTKFKLMLTHNQDEYPYINILNDKINREFSATYNANEDRIKAKEHIKALVKDAKYINIVDSYLYENWNTNFNLLKEILSNNISIVIYSKYEDKLSSLDKDKLKKLKVFIQKIRNFNKNDISISKINIKDIHDRYIITDKIIIIITSGINYIEDKEKEFTYIVKSKN